jgi:ribosomal protein S27AE
MPLKDRFCPDCGGAQELVTHILYDEDQNRIELEFPTCPKCHHVSYDTNY